QSNLISASPDECYTYESSIWTSALEYIDLHENEPAADELAAYLEQIQDEYLAYGREYMGWGLFIFRQ
ncbi:MAG: methyltransferase type 12, partial [Methanocorpusculum sp.]|nr:methyltransferase type 12 [Methanocorpusculum sp.]